MWNDWPESEPKVPVIPIPFRKEQPELKGTWIAENEPRESIYLMKLLPAIQEKTVKLLLFDLAGAYIQVPPAILDPTPPLVCHTDNAGRCHLISGARVD